MFSLDTWTRAKVTHVNKRTENHGQEIVHAMDIDWRIECTNKLLDRIHPSIRACLYRAVGTMPLPDPALEESTPELASELIEGPFALKWEGTGYLLTIRYGEVTGEQIELAGAELKAVRVDCKQGGSMIMMFKSKHSGLSRDLMGVITSIDGREVSLLAAPPAMQEGTAPASKRPVKDTKTRDLPLDGDDAKGETKDATQAFLDAQPESRPSGNKVLPPAKKPKVVPPPEPESKREPRTFKAKAAIADKKKAARTKH